MAKTASSGRNPFPWIRWLLSWDLRRLRKIIARLRRREGTLSFHAEQGGPDAPWARALSADVGCALTDHLGPAADTLERALASKDPLFDEDEPAGGEAA